MKNKVATVWSLKYSYRLGNENCLADSLGTKRKKQGMKEGEREIGREGGKNRRKERKVKERKRERRGKTFQLLSLACKNSTLEFQGKIMI